MREHNISNPDDLPMVLTPADIAAILNVSRNTAYQFIHTKDFPAFRLGKQYRVSKSKFLAWLEAAGDDEKEIA